MKRDVQSEARTEVERAVAVLGSQQKEHVERIQDLKASLASMRDAYTRLETKNRKLAEMLEREQQAREAAKRALAVQAAV